MFDVSIFQNKWVEKTKKEWKVSSDGERGREGGQEEAYIERMEN